MNIFMILASAPRVKMPEEQMSALIGWLLHPDMEHGLGSILLERFLMKSIPEDKTEIINDILSMPAKAIKWSLEHNITVALIDIVYLFGDYVIAIENKIRYQSITDGQLCTQYEGLCKKYPDKKIIHIYLVPNKSTKATTEFGRLSAITKSSDICMFATWMGTVIDVIESVLTDEKSGLIEPLSKDIKYILDSLISFINNNFIGHDFSYEKEAAKYAAYPHVSYIELKTKTQGFVGVELKYQNLYSMPKERILNSSGFQYCDSDEPPRNYWYPIQEFLDIAEQILESNTGDPVIKSNIVTSVKTPLSIIPTQDDLISKYKPNSSSAIYSYLKQPEHKQIFIGIDGGEAFMRNKMSVEEIKRKRKYVCYERHHRNPDNWIPGEIWKRVYEEKLGV